MKIISIVGLLIFISSISYAQTVNDISKIVLGVCFTEDASIDTKSIRPQLEDKLIMFAAKAGYSSFGNSTFFISPNVIVNSVDIAEGGMKNIYVVQGELYLTIQDGINGTVFSSASFPFKGSATKKETAIKNAVLNINYDRVKGIFSEAKKKILSYYEQQQTVIFAYAETCAKNGNFDEAIAYLMMIPEDLTELYVKSVEKAQKIYDLRDEAIRQQIITERYNNNEQILAEANSLLAMHNPKGALEVLWNYRPGNEKQDQQYWGFVGKAEKLISTSEKEALRKEERAYQDNKVREERAWSEYSKERAHQRDMDRKEMNLKGQIIRSTERVAHEQINANRQAIAANERIANHRANVDSQKIQALKTVACEYIRKNPNIDYIHVKF